MGDRTDARSVDELGLFLKLWQTTPLRRHRCNPGTPHTLCMEVQSHTIIRNTTRLFNIPGIHLPQLSSLRNRQQEGRGTNPRGMWREQEGECSGESEVWDHAQGVWGDGTCIMQHSEWEGTRGEMEIWKLRAYTECPGNPRPHILESHIFLTLLR